MTSVREIQDPEKNIPVWQRARLSRIANAKNQEERAEIRKRAELTIGALGDGSDYASFLDHAGISALNIGYGGENDADSYHSIYDDFYWYTHFVDTDFSYGRALAQTGGTTVMRLADADIIPYEYAGMAETIGKYVTELEKQLKEKQDEITERNLELKEGVFTAVADPRKTSVPPPQETTPPYMNFAPLKNGVESIKHSAERYQAAVAKAQADDAPALSPQVLDSLNTDLLKIQRTFLTERGLPERPGSSIRCTRPALTPDMAPNPSPPSANTWTRRNGRRPKLRCQASRRCWKMSQQQLAKRRLTWDPQIHRHTESTVTRPESPHSTSQNARLLDSELISGSPVIYQTEDFIP